MGNEKLAKAIQEEQGVPFHFADRLNAAITQKRSVICVGLDPQLDKLPKFLLDKHKPADAVLEFNKGIIDAIADLVPIVKPQSAFYEVLGVDGMRVLSETLQYAKSKGLLTLLDVKRGDIGNTAEAYARAFLAPGPFEADAVTINPYMGYDSVKPFMSVAKQNGKGVFVLVKTSNPSSTDVQDLVMQDKNAVYEIMGHYVESWGADDVAISGFSLLGAVVGATFPDQAAKLRQIMPQSIFLVPGYGAQGGTAQDVKVCFDERGRGAIINSSRAILYAFTSQDGADYADAAREAVMKMRKELDIL